MFTTLLKGINYTASFLFSAISNDKFTTIIIGVICASILALMIGSFVLHAATASTNILFAAGALSIFSIPLGVGFYFLNKEQFHTLNEDKDLKPEKETSSDTAGILSYLSTTFSFR